MRVSGTGKPAHFLGAGRIAHLDGAISKITDVLWQLGLRAEPREGSPWSAPLRRAKFIPSGKAFEVGPNHGSAAEFLHTKARLSTRQAQDSCPPRP
jgi:hypothetical protein